MAPSIIIGNSTKCCSIKTGLFYKDHGILANSAYSLGELTDMVSCIGWNVLPHFKERKENEKREREKKQREREKEIETQRETERERERRRERETEREKKGEI